MGIKKRSCVSRILLCIVIVGIIDNIWIGKARAFITEEVAAAGLLTAGLFRAVACAGAAVIRACKNSNATHTTYRPVVQNRFARQEEPSVSPEYSACSSITVSLPTTNTISQNISTNSAFIAQEYINSLSEKDRISAEQTARSITASWNDCMRASIVETMRSANYGANYITPDIARWTQSSYTTEIRPGGLTYRHDTGLYGTFGNSGRPKIDHSHALWETDRDLEKCIIAYNPAHNLAVKQIIDSFVQNGQKLVYGSFAERILAAFNLFSFYIDGISYGYDIANTQDLLYPHYYHHDGTICISALKNTEEARTILRDYQGDGSHHTLFHEIVHKSHVHASMCDKTIANNLWDRFKRYVCPVNLADMSTRIVNNESNKKLISILEAFLLGDKDKATKIYHENAHIHGATLLYNELRTDYETAVKKQEALLKDRFGIYHFGVPIEQQDPVFSSLSIQERQELVRNTHQLQALNDYLVTRHHAKNTLHNLWQIPTSVSPTVHRTLYELLDSYNPESRIDKIYEYSQDTQLSDSQKQEIVKALHLPNGVMKDFAGYSRANTINIPAIILLPEHAYTRKILNHLVHTERISTDEYAKQSVANTITHLQELLRNGDTLSVQRLAAYARAIKTKSADFEPAREDHITGITLALDKEVSKAPSSSSGSRKDNLENPEMQEPEHDPKKNPTGALLAAAKAFEEKERIKKKIHHIAKTLPRCLKHNRITRKGVHKVLPADIKDVVIGRGQCRKLEKLFNGRVLVKSPTGHYIKISKIQTRHILGPDLKSYCNKGILEGSGFHHDYMGRAMKSDKFKFEVTQIDDHGVYEAWWSYGNAASKPSTFFPKEWTPCQVIEKVMESLQNGESIAHGPGRFFVNGVTSDGITIKTVLEMIKTDRCKIISSFPVMRR